MKVTFSNCPGTKTEYDVNDVCDIIREFLYNNGILKEVAIDFTRVISKNTIGFKFSCSNSGYTRAMALLMILLSESQTKIGGYMTHIRNVEAINEIGGCTMYFNINEYGQTNKFELLYNWIKSNMSVKVDQ